MNTAIDFLKTKTYLRPTIFFPKDHWQSLQSQVIAKGYTKTKLRELYLRFCCFKEFYRGGVVLEEFFKYCHLEVVKLEHVALRIFPKYEFAIIQKMITKPGSHELQHLVVRPTKPPYDDFVIRAGFAKYKRQEYLYNEDFKIGSKVILKHHGLVDEVRVDPMIVGAVLPDNKGLVLQDQQYEKILETNNADDEYKDDAVAQALQNSMKDLYAINFVKFVRQLLRLFSLDYIELIKYCFMEICEEDLEECVDFLHKKGSSKDRRILKQLARSRFKLDARGYTKIDRLTSFVLVYPAFVYPLVLLKMHIGRRLGLNSPKFTGSNASTYSQPLTQHGDKMKKGFESPEIRRDMYQLCVSEHDPFTQPTSFRLAWAYTGQNVLKNITKSSGMAMDSGQTISSYASSTAEGFEGYDMSHSKKARFRSQNVNPRLERNKNRRHSPPSERRSSIGKISSETESTLSIIDSKESRLTISERRQSVSGRRRSISGRRQSISGRRQSISGRRQSISGRRQSINGRRSSINGRRSSINRGLEITEDSSFQGLGDFFKMDGSDLATSKASNRRKYRRMSQAQIVLSAYDISLPDGKEKKKKRRNTEKKSKLLLKIQGTCNNCKQKKTLHQCRYCYNCLSALIPLIAEQSGYQYASMIVSKANMATETDIDFRSTLEIRFVEQKDPLTNQYFFYNVEDGSSAWKLPHSVRVSEVKRMEHVQNPIKLDLDSSSESEYSDTDESELSYSEDYISEESDFNSDGDD